MKGSLSFFDAKYDRRIMWKCSLCSFKACISRMKFSGASFQGLSARPEGDETRLYYTFDINGRSCVISSITQLGKFISASEYFEGAYFIEKEIESLFPVKFSETEDFLS